MAERVLSRKKILSQIIFALVTVLLTILINACGGDNETPATFVEGPGDDVGYHDNTGVVVVGGKTFVVQGNTGSDCLELNGQCVNVDQIKQEYCNDANAQADIVIVEGKVVKVICYPPPSSGVAIEKATVNNQGVTEVPQNAAHTVITFDEASDGVPVKGDVSLSAENISFIGNGIDKTIIDGSLSMDSNNAQIRGVTITGDVKIDKNSNNNSLAFCKIKGNLEIKANDVTVVSCQVFGNVKIEGNNPVLLGIGVGGSWEVSGSNPTCNDNFQFTDANGDFIIAASEKTADLSCSGKTAATK